MSVAAVMPKGCKQTELGLLPNDWRVQAVGDSVDLLTGFPFPSAGYAKFGVRLLRGSNVKRAELDWSDDITQYWPSIQRDIARYELRIGDLVIAMDGALVGRSYARIVASDLPALLLQRVARLRSTKQLDIDYLASLIASDFFTKHVDSTKTVTAIPHISPEDLRSFTIPIPPSRLEQQAIAGALSDMDTLQAKLDKLIAKKRDVKQAAIQQLLTGKKRLPGFHQEWEPKLLGDLGQFFKGRGIRRDEALSGELPCIRYGEIYTEHDDCIRAYFSWISEAVARTAVRLRRGDLLFAGSGETKEDIGKCVAFLDEIEAYAGGDIVILRPYGSDPVFMGYCLNTRLVNAQKASRGQGDAVVHISAGALSTIQMLVPALSEQIAIGAVLSDIDAELAALESRRDKTRSLKQGMMQELLTGRIRLV